MNIKKTRAAEFRAQDTGRTIVTTYYETVLKAAAMRVTRSLHAHTAVPNVITHMQRGDYDARVAEVWDENKNEVLVTVVIPMSGKTEITYFYDPITGEKLRPQPFEQRHISDTQANKRMANVVDQLANIFQSGDVSKAVVDTLLEKLTTINEQRN